MSEQIDKSDGNGSNPPAPPACTGTCEITWWAYDGYEFLEGPDGEIPWLTREDPDDPMPGEADIGQAVKDAADAYSRSSRLERLCPKGCICSLKFGAEEEVARATMNTVVKWSVKADGDVRRYRVRVGIRFRKFRAPGECRISGDELFELPDPYAEPGEDGALGPF